jgi:electron transport complex protein RnfD
MGQKYKQMKLLTVSGSPHIHKDLSVKKIMYSVVIALLPAIAASVYFFGYGAVQLILVSVISCVLFEYLIQRFLIKAKTTITDGSAVITGILLAFNVPSSLPIWEMIIGAFVAIGIAKMSFGGLGKNPFNPALVGRVFLLISFPVDMTRWPTTRISNIDALTGATPLGIVKEGLEKGNVVSGLMQKIPDYLDLFLGNCGGCLGEVSAIALIIGAIYLLIKKIISWHTPVAYIGTVLVFTGILWLINPEQFIDPLFHLLAGGLILGALFMATDMVTSPMTGKGMLIFGLGCGVITVLIRIFGDYPEGVSFSILIMNAFVPLIDRAFKPKKFGDITKQKN